MSYYRLYISLILTLFFCFLKAPVSATNDSIRISLLTCAPGEEIYTLFGHTAIRYENSQKNLDVVFNYGAFDFNAPNFIMRFILGHTDYLLAVEPFNYFKRVYTYYNRVVYSQELNLTQKEKEKLVDLLIINSRPENRVYRYNYFFDNCATRPRQIIEKSTDAKVIYSYTTSDSLKTFRDIIYEHTQNHLWSRFGINFCIGSGADRPIKSITTLFAPFYLKDAFKNACLQDTVKTIPLVAQESILVKGENKKDEKTNSAFLEIVSPFRASLLFFISITLCTIYGLKKRKNLWGLDFVLFLTSGLCGCIIAFLALFSEHPMVSPNYLLFVFHPIHLVGLFFIVKNKKIGKKSCYHVINVVILTLFIVLFPLIPQRFDLAIVPLALCLLERSASNIILNYKGKVV